MNTSRRNFISKALAAGLGAQFFLNGMNPEKTSAGEANTEVKPLPSLKGKKVLYVYGGWEGHEPVKSFHLLNPWLEEEGAIVTASQKLDIYTDKKIMGETDLVIQIYTMSEISEEQEKGLLEAVKNGTGMAGWHGGMCDAFRQNTEYQFMTGGQWVAHPGGVIDYSVQITDSADPVTMGLADFKMKSEQYYMHVDPNVKVLATTRFNGDHAPWIDGATMPVTWKKMYGKGRIFYTSLGHVMADLQVPEAMAMLKRGIRWASASKYEPPEKWLSPVY